MQNQLEVACCVQDIDLSKLTEIARNLVNVSKYVTAVKSSAEGYTGRHENIKENKRLFGVVLTSRTINVTCTLFLKAPATTICCVEI